ncbi:MAG TPA: nucleotide disphospho-sugar-binding domain-containing protein [Allosphingosinicella sp.]|jgi:MGT family glycosyltransferase
MAVLGRELIGRGHRVTFFGFPDMAPRLPPGCAFQAVGERDQPLGSLEPYLQRLSRLGGPLSYWTFIHDLAGFTDVICRDLPGILNRLAPDALIIDQTDAASSLVATALGVPFVNVANALPLNLEPAVPPPVLPWPYDPSSKGLRRNRGGYRVARLVERPITRVIRRHARRFGRPEIRFADDTWSQRLQITQCVRGLDFPRVRLPATFHYVGPFREADASLDFDLPADGKPVIFCSLGTLQGSRAKLFQAVAGAAADLDVTLVIAHGGLLPESEIARLPGRPIVRSYVPQRALLSSCALAVTHAGFNTVIDALSFGVPMVALPIAFEQPATGARLERAGAAVVVHRRRTQARIGEALRAVLTGRTYRANAGRLAAEIAGAGGVKRAACLVEQILP